MKWILNHLNELMIAIVAVLAPEIGIMVAVGCLILFDMITGIAAAYKVKTPVTSRKMSRTISKTIFYTIAILAGVAIQYIMSDVLPVTKIVAGVISIVEATSIFENLYKITGVNYMKYLKGIFERQLNKGENN
jgi:hypothetical protein